jgi:hypothetical protein
MGIDTEELPGPSMNVRKPTKKQAAEAVKVRAAQDAKIERGRAKLAMARANREAKAAEQLRMKEEEAKAAEQLRMKEEESKPVKDYTDKERLIENWGLKDERLFDIYNYRDYKDLDIKVIDRFIKKLADKDYTIVVNFLADKLPKDLIDTIYQKYGLKTLLLGMLYIVRNLTGFDQEVMLDEHKLPGAKLNKEYQAFIKPYLATKENIGYNNLVKILK